MVLTGRHAVSIGGDLMLEEIQVGDVVGRFSCFPWWKVEGRCRNYEVCVVNIAP